MLKLDTIRGPHSTGVLAVNSNGDTEIQKTLGTPWDFLDSKKAEAIFRPFSNVLLGHNRYATQGKINKANAHPFDFPSFAGVHNGTLRGQYRLPDHQRFDVDSENIYHSMQQQGEIATLENLDGAFALVWWNKEEQVLRMARNDERPLHFAFTEDFKAVLWASEPWMISVAAGRSNVKINPIQQIVDEHMYTFHIPLQGFSGTKEVPEPDMQRFQEYIRPVQTHNYSNNRTGGQGNGGSFHGGRGGTTSKKDGAGQANSSTTSSGTSTDKKSSNVIALNSSDNIYSGDTVEFMMTDTSSKVLSGSYIEGVTTEGDVKVRVYTPLNGVRWKEMCEDESGFFLGKVARIKWDNGVKFLVMEVNSIKSCEEDAVTGMPVYNTVVSTAEWEQHVKNGCCICGDVADSTKAGEYLWLAHRTYACDGCKESEIVKEYTNA